MSKFVRTSKVRHLFGKEQKAEQMVTDVRVGRGTGDHQYIKVKIKLKRNSHIILIRFYKINYLNTY